MPDQDNQDNNAEQPKPRRKRAQPVDPLESSEPKPRKRTRSADKAADQPKSSADRATRTAKSTEKPDKTASNTKAADKKPKAPAEKAPPKPPMDRGKWRGGTFRQRFQRILWIFYLLYRFAPAWILVTVLLVIFGPGLLRSLRKPPTIAPFYTPEVQHWSPQIARWSVEYNVNPNLIATLMQIESCGYPGAASSVGAQGLFQVMPMNFADNEPMTDPETNAKRGIGVIRDCLNYANGDVGLAMACYNGGPSLINRNPANWPTESQHYYNWGLGMYNDAISGRETSTSLQNWLQAGGSGLCQQASVALGLTTAEPTMITSPAAPSDTALPTFVPPPSSTPTPSIKLFLTPEG